MRGREPVQRGHGAAGKQRHKEPARRQTVRARVAKLAPKALLGLLRMFVAGPEARGEQQQTLEGRFWLDSMENARNVRKISGKMQEKS